jgi:hypothetical protein
MHLRAQVVIRVLQAAERASVAAPMTGVVRKRGERRAAAATRNVAAIRNPHITADARRDTEKLKVTRKVVVPQRIKILLGRQRLTDSALGMWIVAAGVMNALGRLSVAKSSPALSSREPCRRGLPPSKNRERISLKHLSCVRNFVFRPLRNSPHESPVLGIRHECLFGDHHLLPVGREI